MSIESRHLSNDAVGLMSQKILSFPEEAQVSLKLVACLGSVCEVLINCLAEGKGLRMENKKSIQCLNDCNQFSNLLKWLEFSVDEGLMIREGSKFKFIHDQIQLAAYSLIPESERDFWHLKIGTWIWASDKTM
eukprot:63837-Ditylum_brightwellii.AAC.1